MQEAAVYQALGNWSVPLPHPRLRIYRNNVSAALVNALKVRFPVTEQLVGAEFFFAMARAFADANRPRSAVLIGYGDDFPDFIRDFAPADGVPYLADVAALESLWWRAYHAGEAGTIRAEALSGLPEERWPDLRFRLHPSAGLMRSSHAAASIWRAHHGGPPMSAIRTGTPETILVSRPHGEVLLRVITPASFAFLAALLAGRRLGDAVEDADCLHPDFDTGAQIGALFSLELVTGYDT
jgi:hypothetical protein